MHRLTKRQAFTIGGVIYAKCENCHNKLPECCEEDRCSVPLEALNKLAAYEDICFNADGTERISIDRLRELAEADKDGRLVVLPCKVGDTVWTNFSVVGSYLREKDRPYACKVLFIGLNQSNSGGYINIEYVKSGYQFPLDFDAFDKTVFLAREAAEAALKAGEPQ